MGTDLVSNLLFCWHDQRGRGCVQVPSFDSKVAMAMIAQELGRPWQQVYSELTPRPIAAASLGQVLLPSLLYSTAFVVNPSIDFLIMCMCAVEPDML